MSAEIQQELLEREKELDGLYCIAELCLRTGLTPRSLLTETIRVLPSAFQYPNTLRAFARYKDLWIPETPSRANLAHCISADILGAKDKVGEILAAYEEKDAVLHGFLHRERYFLETVGRLLSDTLRRLLAEKKIYRQNQALKEILFQIETDRRALLSCVRSVLEGEGASLVRKMTEANETVRRAAAENLLRLFADIPREYGYRNDLEGHGLSLREVEICRLIRGGMSTKEIAKFLGISTPTVERHRHNIRGKLGIEKAVSLASYLVHEIL